MDAQLLPWLDWAYNESIIRDAMQPAGVDNLRSLDALTALVRPYPLAVTGTPTMLAFDAATKVFDFTYATAGPDGGKYASDLVTIVSIPARHYPNGYAVTVDGATVVSTPGASRLLLRNSPGAGTVSVQVREEVTTEAQRHGDVR
jgi:endoglycosylceramidase